MDNKIKDNVKDNVLGKLIIITWIILLMFSACGLIVEAAPTEPINPQPENQYFELKAKSIEVKDGR